MIPRFYSNIKCGFRPVDLNHVKNESEKQEVKSLRKKSKKNLA